MIKITDDYYIDVGECGYVAFKQLKSINSSTGKSNRSTVGYFEDMRGAVMFIVERALADSVRDEGIITLAEALRRMNKAYIEISRLIRAAVPDLDACVDIAGF